ncbi:MAG: hypothetical protein ACRDV3_08955 [Acidothermaceae bacterium]
MELTCSDSTQGNAPSPLSPDGLTFEGLGDKPLAYAASDVGLRVPAAGPHYFRKAPVYLTAGTSPVAVQLTTPGSYLAWVPAGVWTSGAPPDVGPWIATNVIFDGCPDRDSTYLGGLLVPNAQVCLTLIVTHTGASLPTSRLHLGSAGC